MELCALSCRNRKGSNTNCWHKVGSTLSKVSFYASAFWFPFIGTKGTWTNQEKQLQTESSRRCPHTLTQCIFRKGKTNPLQLLSACTLSPALSDQTTATTSLNFLQLTFSQSGSFLCSWVNGSDVPGTSCYGVHCVRHASDGEKDRKQLLGFCCFTVQPSSLRRSLRWSYAGLHRWSAMSSCTTHLWCHIASQCKACLWTLSSLRVLKYCKRLMKPFKNSW